MLLAVLLLQAFQVPTPTATATPLAIQVSAPTTHAPPALAGAPSSASRTAAPTAAVPASSTAPAPTVPVSAGSKTLSDIARERKLAREAKPGAASFSVTGAAAGGPLPAGQVASAAKANDNAEQYWRARSEKLHSEARDADAALVRAEAENPIPYLAGGGISAAGMATRNAALTPYRLRAEEAAAALARLPEECRAAGCSPGWIR